jgi:putative membrane protein
MMYWWGDQMNGWGWALMSISTVVFWALMIVGIVALIRYARSPGPDRRSQTRPAPEQVLAERYARGEIDESEYRRRLDTLGSAGVTDRM